jgi:hypothetical protein
VVVFSPGLQCVNLVLLHVHDSPRVLESEFLLLVGCDEAGDCSERGIRISAIENRS